MNVETFYRVEPRGGRDPGIGVHIRAFPDGHESLWIDCLTALEGARPPADSAQLGAGKRGRRLTQPSLALESAAAG